MIASLLPILQTQALVLTPNQRLAATLIKRYNQEHLKQAQTCWPSPAIRPFSAWIQELWHQYSAEHMNADLLPLTANQELILWEEVIAEEPDSGLLLKLSDLAKQAKSAWTTLRLWQIDFDHPSFAFTENSRHFQAWAERFAQRCLEEGWLDNASLTDRLIEEIRQNHIPLPREVVLLNFTEIAPQHRDLLAACASQGMRVEQLETQAEHAPFQISLADEETEIQTMARWARKIHEHWPEATIGCIASNLEEKREALLSAFNEVFEGPESYNISAGRTLASYPLIQQALALLNLPLKSLSSATVSALLHSPFLGDAEKEMLPRIQLDSQLRRRNLTKLSWQDLLTELTQAHCEQLAARLQCYLEQRKTQPATQRISHWLAHFAQLLTSLGWPGEQSLNSTEYQVVGRWQDLILDAGSLDSILAKVNAAKALHYLTVLATKTYFQPETPDAPVQILGQLEGAGLPFDFLWVLGLDDTAWPPVPTPNPLIPHDLQKTFGMPNATAERQLDYSRRLTKQFKQAAPVVFFSYAERNEKEALRPSPLLAGLEVKNLVDLDLAPLKATLQTVFHSQKLETLHDEKAPPLQAQEKLQGGKDIFEMQAACPFKAFAKLRLRARALEETQAGLPAKSRGSVIHKALELFWKTVKDHKTLLAFSPEDLETQIHQALTAALAEAAPFIRQDALYHDLLQQRLKSLLRHWLELEKARPPFTVAALEQTHEIRMDDFPITLRVDRVDRLPEGDHLVIDYKTRENCELSGWFGERPDEPQLPLYCLTQQETVSGLIFAQLHAAKTALKGLAQRELYLAGVKILNEKSKADAPTWEGQLEQWRINLRQLFLDFQHGEAAVDPKSVTKSCRHCDLQTFCRIHEDRSFSYDQNDS